MAILRKPVTVVWLILMLATCATTWWLSKDAFSPVVAALSILSIAAVKARLVLLHFMELKNAPLRWRLLFEAWVLISIATVLGIYLRSPAA
jgi:hypothetical protein